MLSFTKRADYALLALTFLTVEAKRGKERLINTKEISERFHIPLEILAKILQVLARNNLIASFPGPTGGYRLARSAKHISVADVVRLVDGQLGMVHCSNGNDLGCEQFAHCTIRNPLSLIEQRMYRLLEEMSIEEISHEKPDTPESPRLVTITDLLRQ